MTAIQRTDEANRTALITGASRGIGYELAKLFAADGYNVVLVARSREDLHRVADEFEDANDITATVISKDLSTPGAAEELYDAVTDRNIPIDALVNNAGFSIYGRFCDTDRDQERNLLQLNLVTLTELTKLFARPMCERGTGQILNISSLASVYPTPKATVYAATKSYITSFSVALADELAEDGITVSVLCPSETDTDIFQRGGMQKSALPEHDLLDPKAVAQSGYNGLQRGQTVVVPGGLKDKFLYHLPRILPETTAASIARDHWEPE